MPMKNPAHPGRLIEADLDALNLSVAQGAKALGVSRAQLNRVIKGSSKLSAEMALRLERLIGSTADTWLRLQTAYDATQVRARAAEITDGLKRIETPA